MRHLIALLLVGAFLTAIGCSGSQTHSAATGGFGAGGSAKANRPVAPPPPGPPPK